MCAQAGSSTELREYPASKYGGVRVMSRSELCRDEQEGYESESGGVKSNAVW